MANEVIDVSAVNPKADLANSTKELVNNIVSETDPDKLKDLTNLFKVNQKKREYCRIERLNNLQDLIDAELLNRMECYSDAIENKDLISMLNATNIAINNTNNAIDAQPTVQINNTEINVNNSSGLDRASRERVLAAVNEILNNSLHNSEDNDIIDVEVK